MINPTLKQTVPRVEITKQHSDFFGENGYLVVENALTPNEVETLHRETVDLSR